MAVGLHRSGDWLAARRSDQCAAPPANHRCAVDLLTAIAAREFRLLDFAPGIAAPGGLMSGFALHF